MYQTFFESIKGTHLLVRRILTSTATLCACWFLPLLLPAFRSFRHYPKRSCHLKTNKRLKKYRLSLNKWYHIRKIVTKIYTNIIKILRISA